MFTTREMIVIWISFSAENSYSFPYWSLQWNSSLLGTEANLFNAQHVYISTWNRFFSFGIQKFVWELIFPQNRISGHCVPSTFRLRKWISCASDANPLSTTRLYNPISPYSNRYFPQCTVVATLGAKNSTHIGSDSITSMAFEHPPVQLVYSNTIGGQKS